jgi:hypothetical protein
MCFTKHCASGQNLIREGVFMYLLEMTSPITLDVSKFCIEKIIELCATQINTGKRVLIESKVSYSFSNEEKLNVASLRVWYLVPFFFLFT